MKNKFNKQIGFTLFELIIYLGIVSILLVSLTSLMLNILTGQARNFAQQEVNYNLKFISNNLAGDIKKANQIGSLSTTTLVLNFPGPNTVTYKFDRDRKLMTRQDNAGAAEEVSTKWVNIGGDFTDLSFKNKSKNVGIALAIEYDNPANMSYYNASTTDSFAVELRGKR
jgi:type II secretory pathway pseudopilin PulG